MSVATRTLDVGLGARSYPIHIGSGLLEQAELLAERMPQPRCAIVTNTTVAPLYLAPLQRALERAGVQSLAVVLPDGEAHKTWETLAHVFDRLLEARCERRTTLVALGGGVVGDLTGFAAATYQRGVPFAQVPTTLLAQVDSSVGGKTAINHPLGKNMIGAFHQPDVVLADLATLQSLPPRELSAGLAEVIKYGLLGDLDFLEWLETHIDALVARDEAALAVAVERSCAHKAAIVARDERETGERALLNLGHTFGHAIESGLGFGTWLHGEAVAAGMLLAARASEALGHLSSADVRRVRDLLVRARLPIDAPDLGVERWLDLMGHDKKVEEGRLRFVLLEKLGRAYLDRDVPTGVLRAVLTHPAPAALHA
jgi:3-dehydroquinate synthase